MGFDKPTPIHSPDSAPDVADVLRMELPSAGSGSRVRNIGNIESIVPPAGWRDSGDTTLAAGAYFRAFENKSDESKLCYFFRGGPVGQSSAKAFHDALSKPPHKLNMEELAPLQSVLRGRFPDSQFALAHASTENLNGRSVLVIEGKYTDKNVGVAAVYADADGTGRFVQEVYYQSPAASYDKDRPAAIAAMKSINWR